MKFDWKIAWRELNDTISSFDWQLFHFLRPKALYLFAPLAVIVLLLIVSNRDKKKWKGIVEEHLRPFMFSKSSRWAILLPLLLFITATTLGILALSGPTWKRKTVPGESIQAVVLIAIDLSGSMLASDIQPNRLDRAKFKISDFLDANPRARAGLLAYAGTAHPVLPFTSDYKIVKHHATSLANHIMPLQGTNIEILLQQVDSMMHHIEAPSSILLMTDEIDTDDATLIADYMSKSIHRLEILLVSSQQGAAVPHHANVVSRQDPGVMANLVQASNILVTPLTLDKSDVVSIAARISNKLTFTKVDKEDENEWDDMGWLVMIPCAMVAAFWFRRGWVIQWCILAFVSSVLTSCGIDSRHPDWWYSKDYQGQLLQNDAKYEEAADRFESDNRKAVAYYKSGDYSSAADLFALDSSGTSNYNRGLALAQLGRYAEAQRAFEAAAKIDPSLSTRASTAIDQAKLAGRKADSVLRYDQEGKQIIKNKKDGKKEDRSDSVGVKKVLRHFDRTVEAELDKDPDKKQKHDNVQSTSILLRQSTADPTDFLKKRFELQRTRYYKHVKQTKETW